MDRKILIIEDEPDTVQILTKRLSDNGFAVVVADDGYKGIELAHKEKPDLIILDLMLPKMDGQKVCGLLKRDTRCAKIPIIIFSARAQKEDMELGKELGADAYITKPFESQILLSKITELLADNPKIDVENV